MFRSYWIIIFTIGLIISPLHPHDASAQNQEQATNEQINITLPTFGLVNESDESNRANKPCKQGEDDRSSDLCAQWKAADAAKQAADWTVGLGIFGVVLGTLTLCAAGAAAFYAKRAADATENTLHAGRAWMVCETFIADHVENANIAEGTQEPIILFGVKWKNVGNTPAVEAAVFFDLRIIAKGDDLPVFDSTNNVAAPNAPIGPTTSVTSPKRYVRMADVTPIGESENIPVLYSRIVYKDIYNPDIERHAEICVTADILGNIIDVNGKDQPYIEYSVQGPQNTAN